MKDIYVQRLVRLILAIWVLIAVGTAGYVFIEGWPLLDSFYMTLITLSTVGYSETHALSPQGRVFTSTLIMLCLVSMTFWTATLTSFIVGADLQGKYLRRRTLKMVARLKHHSIVCGSGAMAEAVIERLLRAKQAVVLVSDQLDQIQRLRQRFPNLLVIEGKPTDELSLAEANILHASHVVAATDSDIDNLLIVITCKDIGGGVAVYARANDTTIANRMRKAGVDEVISPYQLSGERVAELILSPTPTEQTAESATDDIAALAASIPLPNDSTS